MNQNDLINLGQQVIMHTYNYLPVVVDKGCGCYLWDLAGKKYLDFVSGVAVNSLGYSNKTLINNLNKQMNKLFHCSNLYYNQKQIELAQLLVNNSCFNKAFFCNSGAEAVEAALKLARKYGKKHHGEHCTRIIAMERSFHGRTMGAVSLTGQEKYQKGLEPLLPDVIHIPFNDSTALKKAVSEETCAVLIEPVQGEGGINPATKEFLQTARNLCTEKNILLMFDEVQCGIGRTGKLFAYEHFGITPDVISLAKGLGAGFPIGAMMATDKAANAFSPGDHASTFGGNPLGATAGITVINELLENKLLDNVVSQGKLLTEKLNMLKVQHNIINDVRGIGLMQGIELSIPAKPIISRCMEKGLLLVGAGEQIIRFVPPLIISAEEINEGINILSEVIQEVKNESKITA